MFSTMAIPLGSPKKFIRLRAQILLFSAQAFVHVRSPQTVRNAIAALLSDGISSLTPQPMGPKYPTRAFDDAGRERLIAIAHQSPLAFGKAQSQWTLTLLSAVAHEQKLTNAQVSIETIRQAIIASASTWSRAKNLQKLQL